MNEDDPVRVMALTMWGEDRSGGTAGMTAVGWVIQNRVKRPGWWGRDVVSVCKAKGQFDCWMASDPNYGKLLAVTEADESFALAMRLAAAIQGGMLTDPTGEATNYHTVAKPAWAGVWPPDWTNGLVRTAEIAGQVYYRPYGGGGHATV